MGWQREGQYALRNGRWTIAKYTVDDRAKYVLWQDKEWIAGPFDTADEAKAKHREIEDGVLY